MDPVFTDATRRATHNDALFNNRRVGKAYPFAPLPLNEEREEIL
jgi:hypothetical protein